MKPERAAPWPTAEAAAVMACISVTAVTLSLSIPLLGILLDLRGTPGWLIGVHTAMPALASILAPPFLPALMKRMGLLPFLYACLGTAALCLALFPLIDGNWAWLALRFVFGVPTVGLFLAVDIWINHAVDESRRGRTIGIYSSGFAAGILIGPLVLQLTGVEGALPFLAGAAITLAAGIPLAFVRAAPAMDEQKATGLIRAVRSSPLPFAAALLFGGLEFAFLGLLPVWAMRNGMDDLTATRLVTWMGAGNAGLQWAVGRISDRLPRRDMLLICAGAGIAGSLAMPLLVAAPNALGLSLLLWGGVLMGLYPVGIGMVGQRFAGPRLAAANAAFAVAYGIGGLAGPLIVGVLTDPLPLFGLPLALGLSCLAFVLLGRRAA